MQVSIMASSSFNSFKNSGISFEGMTNRVTFDLLLSWKNAHWLFGCAGLKTQPNRGIYHLGAYWARFIGGTLLILDYSSKIYELIGNY